MSWAVGDANKLSRKPFGQALAQRFIEALQHKSAFTRTHQGYCGWIAGYSAKRRQFVFTRSWEGWIGVDGDKPDLVWNLSQKLELIDWLAHQSDYSMSGADPNSKIVDLTYTGNQTICEEYIREFLKEVDAGKVLYDSFQDY